MIFTYKHKTHPTHLSINNTELVVFGGTKFLVLTFDRRLAWRLCIFTLKKKCLMLLSILKIMNKKCYGLSSTKLLNEYSILIRSKLDCWSPVCASPFNCLLNAFELAQNACLHFAHCALSVLHHVLVSTHSPIYLLLSTTAKFYQHISLSILYLNSVIFHIPAKASVLMAPAEASDSIVPSCHATFFESYHKS